METKIKTIKINKTDITVKEYLGKRVVTLKEIDACHNRPEGQPENDLMTTNSIVSRA